jgi:hypothetical protein
LEDLYEALGHEGVSEGSVVTLAWRGTKARERSALRAETLRLPYDKYLGRADESDRKRIAAGIDKTLAAAEALLDGWAVKGTQPTLNSSALLVPFYASGPTVLDATAREDFIYKLMVDRAAITLTPSRADSWSAADEFNAARRCAT